MYVIPIRRAPFQYKCDIKRIKFKLCCGSWAIKPAQSLMVRTGNYVDDVRQMVSVKKPNTPDSVRSLAMSNTKSTGIWNGNSDNRGRIKKKTVQ